MPACAVPGVDSSICRVSPGISASEIAAINVQTRGPALTRTPGHTAPTWLRAEGGKISGKIQAQSSDGKTFWYLLSWNDDDWTGFALQYLKRFLYSKILSFLENGSSTTKNCDNILCALKFLPPQVHKVSFHNRIHLLLFFFHHHAGGYMGIYSKYVQTYNLIYRHIEVKMLKISELFPPSNPLWWSRNINEDTHTQIILELIHLTMGLVVKMLYKCLSIKQKLQSSILNMRASSKYL